MKRLFCTMTQAEIMWQLYSTIISVRWFIIEEELEPDPKQLSLGQNYWSAVSSRHAIILESFDDHLCRGAQEGKIVIDNRHINNYLPFHFFLRFSHLSIKDLTRLSPLSLLKTLRVFHTSLLIKDFTRLSHLSPRQRSYAPFHILPSIDLTRLSTSLHQQILHAFHTSLAKILRTLSYLFPFRASAIPTPPSLATIANLATEHAITDERVTNDDNTKKRILAGTSVVVPTPLRSASTSSKHHTTQLPKC
jgi:hypothetical protein